MRRSFMLVTMIFLLIGICLESAYSQNKVVILASGAGHPMYLVAQKLLPEAYKKIGYDMELKDVPALRADSMIDKSEADGWIFADVGYAKKHPTSVMVKTPLGYDDFVVFTKTVNFKPNGWASLKPYTIGYMLGMVVVEENIKGMKVDASQNPDQALAKLNAGRIDVVVLPVFLHMMFKNKYPEIKYLLPPLVRVELYTFVSAKRADLAPKLAAALSELKASGRIKALTDQVTAEMQK